MSWSQYVDEHSTDLGSREKRLVAQGLEATAIIKAAHPDLTTDQAVDAAIRLIEGTSHQRALEQNTAALYDTHPKEQDK